MSQTPFDSRACVFEEKNQSFFSFLSLLNLTLEHVIHTVFDVVDHVGQLFLGLVTLLSFLVKLVMELTYLFRQNVHQDMTVLFSLLVFLNYSHTNLIDLSSKSILIAIPALFAGFLLFS